MACAKCHPTCSKMLRQFAPVRAITLPFGSKIHPGGAIRANRRLLCATWWLVCAKGRQIGLNLPPLGATCRLYKYRPSATWFRPSSATVWTTSLLNINNFDMSEAFDNVGVMMLLHQKMMRDAEVATAYQLMLANPEEEEPPKKKRKHNWWFRPMLHPQLRAERGQYHNLMEELRENDRSKFKNYTRVSPEILMTCWSGLHPTCRRRTPTSGRPFPLVSSCPSSCAISPLGPPMPSCLTTFEWERKPSRSLSLM